MTTDITSTTQFVVNQTAFYIAFLVSLASAGAIGLQVYRGLNNRIKRGREEEEAKSQAQHTETKKYVDEKMKEVNEIKDRVEYIYRKIIDKYLNNHDKSRKDL